LISGIEPSYNKIDFICNQNYGKNLMVKTSTSLEMSQGLKDP
jgi:hypothetical protein